MCAVTLPTVLMDLDPSWAPSVNTALLIVLVLVTMWRERVSRRTRHKVEELEETTQSIAQVTIDRPPYARTRETDTERHK